MTWFRVGGGGVPASLRYDMNVVLNKKFRSLDDYDPEQWPGLTNLLGKLPEATVSGAIANITDGADRVPTKNVIATIAPTLDGVSSVTVTQIGQNLLETQPIYTSSSDTLCIDLGENKTFSEITFSFLATNCVVDTLVAALVDYRENDGTHHYRTLNSFRDLNGNQFVLNTPNNGTFKDTQTNITFRYVYVSYTSTTRSKFSSDSASNWQLEIGSTVHDYEPYQTPTTYTAQLGRTVYGGTADLVTGEGVDENGNDYTFTGQEIDTLLGVNNFWNDAGGDTSVTYRRDIDLALQAASG